jgi:hypothetical protein
VYTKEEIRESGLHLFRNFAALVWKHLGLPELTPVQISICDTLQFAPETITFGDRLIVQAFRGVGKSWLTAAFALWNLFINPQYKILVVSANQSLADNLSIFCKSLIADMPILAFLRPREGQRSSNLAWDVGPAQPDPAPSMKSAGITGQITGSRADLIIADDIEVPKNSYTHILRERLAELVKEFDAILKPGGRIVYLGTPQIEQSLYRRLESRDYSCRIWPVEVPSDPSIYMGRLSPFIVRLMEAGMLAGAPVEPSRFGAAELYKRRASYGAAGYALQFMLDTSPSDINAHPLKLRDLIILDCDALMGPVRLAWGASKELVLEDLPPGGFDGDLYHKPAFRSNEMTEYQGTVMYVDPSGMGEDETGYAIVKHLNGILYLVDVGGFRDGFSETTLSAIAAAGARHKVGPVVVEENYGGGMYATLLKPHLLKQGGGSIDEDYDSWSRGQKELRICDTLQPVLESHRLVVDRRVIEKDLQQQANKETYSFIYQLTRMKRLKGALAHEDRLESVAGAVEYFATRLARDTEQAHDEHLEQLRLRDLERFMENALNIGEGQFRGPSTELMWHKQPDEWFGG